MDGRLKSFILDVIKKDQHYPFLKLKMEIVSVVILRKNGFPIMASILKTQKQYCLILPVPDISLPNKQIMISTALQHKDPALMEEKKPT
jgi:hypothetical protein